MTGYNYNIDLYGLLASYFGRTIYQYTLPNGEQAKGGVAYGALPKGLAQPSTIKSSIGTPIITPIEILDGRYSARVRGKDTNVRYEGMNLPPATLIEVSQAKRIVRTPVPGRNGTVKELVSLDDWSIKIKGLMVNEDANELPRTQMEHLKTLCQIPRSLEVVCDVFEWLGIFTIAVKSLSFPSMEGSQRAQPFVIECYSDDPIELDF